ncbi:MAG: hypothetical protein AB1644_06495 [Candidatus Zixiibacteriota bacterium]
MTTSVDVFEQFRLSNLPPYAKLFVGLFTALMLLVCFYAVWIFYERKGKVTPETPLPEYLQLKSTVPVKQLPSDVRQDINEMLTDSQAVLAPKWDSESAGRERRIDSATAAAIARKAMQPNDEQREHRRFSHNLGLAHTHINGQTLLFFGIGLVFLFSSASPKLKKILYWVFGVSIVAHAIGLTGQGYYRLFDDLLAISGLVLLVVIAYMSFLIFVDLSRRPSKE